MATAILLVAAGFRFVALREVPPGLAQDEVLNADIVSFIRGGEHAFFFRHGYGHEPLYHYWSVPFQVLLGDNVLSMRLPAAYLGLLLVALAMCWARREFGRRAGWLTGILLAISWWPIIFSRIGLRPILEPVLLVLAVWFWPIHAASVTREGQCRALVAGVLIGLAIYSYTAAWFSPLIPAIYLAYLVLRRTVQRREKTLERDVVVRGSRTPEGDQAQFPAQLQYALIVLLVPVAMAVPLAMTLRANPELVQRVEQLEGPLDALRAGDTRPILETAAATAGVFGLTGDPRWTYSLPNRPLFDGVTATLFLGGLALALWRWRQPAYALLCIWLVVGSLPSALTPDAPSTVRLVGALPVFYLLPALFIDYAAGRMGTHGRHLAAGALTAGIALLLLGNAARTIRDGFLRWPAELETRLRYQSILGDIVDHAQSGALDGRSFVVTEVFYEPIDAASLDRALGEASGARWIQSGAGVAGALVWPGPAARDDTLGPAWLYVPEYAPLDATLFDLAGLPVLPVYRSDTVPAFALYELPPLDPAGYAKIGEPFAVDNESAGSLASLEGVIPLQAWTSDDRGVLHFATVWQVSGDLPDDIAVFAHLLDSGGHVVAQHDGLDAAAETLQPGDWVLQHHSLALPELLPGESYEVRVGLYTRGAGARFRTPTGSDALMVAGCAVVEGESLTISLVCDLPDES